MISDLPKGAIDVIVAGHTHAGVAHRIADIAVIESYSSGRAFGRIDLRINADGHVIASQIMKPHEICPTGKPPEEALTPVAQCTPGAYEGKPVVADAAVQKATTWRSSAGRAPQVRSSASHDRADHEGVRNRERRGTGFAI